MQRSKTKPFYRPMGTIGPTTNHSTGTDDRPLAFEVTSAERSRPGRPSSFLNGKERKQAHPSPLHKVGLTVPGQPIESLNRSGLNRSSVPTTNNTTGTDDRPWSS